MADEMMIIGGVTLRCDPVRTRALDKHLGSASSKCDCCGCRNFSMIREELFAREPIAEFFRQFGLETVNDHEVQFIAPNGETEALYTGSVFIVAESDLPDSVPLEYETMESGMAVAMGPGCELHHLCDGFQYSVGRPDPKNFPGVTPNEVVEIGFNTFIEWTIPDPIPEFNPHLG